MSYCSISPNANTLVLFNLFPLLSFSSSAEWNTNCRARLAVASRLLLWLDKQQAIVCTPGQTLYEGTDSTNLSSTEQQKKRNFFFYILQVYYYFTYPQCLLPLSICVCLNQDNLRALEPSRLKEHTRPLSKHVTPELSPPVTHAWPLQMLSQWQIRHKKCLWRSWRVGSGLLSTKTNICQS